jgi:hypothetical protein
MKLGRIQSRTINCYIILQKMTKMRPFGSFAALFHIKDPWPPDYKGSTYNIQVEWETGEVTNKPLSLIAIDNPLSCAIYARDNDLLHLTGWKQFKAIAKREKKLIRMANHIIANLAANMAMRFQESLIMQ